MPCSSMEPDVRLDSISRSSTWPVKMPHVPLLLAWTLRTVTNSAKSDGTPTERTPARGMPVTAKPSMTMCDARSRLMPSGVVAFRWLINTPGSAKNSMGAAAVPLRDK